MATWLGSAGRGRQPDHAAITGLCPTLVARLKAAEPRGLIMFQSNLPRHSAGRRVRNVVIIFYAVILSLLAWQFVQEWNAYRGAKDALRHFTAFKAAIQAISDITAERGPTNGLLGDDLPLPAIDMARLVEARRRSDARMEHLLQTLQELDCGGCAFELAKAIATETDLAAARKEVDNLIAMPLADRTSTSIAAVVDHMITLVPQLSSIASARAVAVVEGDPYAMGFIYPAGYAAVLRLLAVACLVLTIAGHLRPYDHG